MDRNYYQIYENLYSDYLDYRSYRRWPWPRQTRHDQSLELARQAVDQALRKYRYGYAVRPDARLLLIINVHQLVLWPVLLGDRERNPQGLAEAVSADVGTMLEEARRGDDGEISSAGILRSLAQSLDRLNLKDFKIWSGADDE